MTRTAAKPPMYGDRDRWALIAADAFALLPQLPEHSVDAIVTDPPYGINFGKKAWDGRDIRRRAQASSDRRLSDGEAFEMFTAAWAANCLRALKPGGYMVTFSAARTFHRLVVGIEEAGLEVRDQLLWLYGTGVPKSRRLPDGRGTTLKPAFEPILLARRPIEGATADNLAAHGTGALNIEAAGISVDGTARRWPSNVTYSHSAGCTAVACKPICPAPIIDAGSAGTPPSRLFYAAKASREEREAGCEALPEHSVPIFSKGGPGRPRRNIHPTVKPIDLMRWLVRLVCPAGGVVLDPFAGSGSTGAATVLEGRQFVGIERDTTYAEIARARIAHWSAEAARLGETA